ncbi:MAG: DUF2339 domain-containing protein [Ignavibacteriaceae bacterium]|nr:DUF2339 domain-containing protein [Ignavibacteriaceae bacterium]
MELNPKENEVKSIWERLKEIDLRLFEIEKKLEIENYDRITDERGNEERPHKKTIESIEKDDVLEYRIGQFWFAKIGILAFVVGIMFVLTLPHEDLPRLLPAAAGLVLSFCFLIIPKLFKSLLPQLSGYIVGGGLVLLYFTVLRVHFLEKDPLIENAGTALILLNAVFIIGLIISLKRKSVYITNLSILLGYLTAILGENPYYIFTWITIISAISVYIKIKYKWETFLTLSIFLAYLTHFIWFINNPLLGHELAFVTGAKINILFPFLYFIVFTSAYTIRRDEQGEPFLKIFNVAFNSALFYFLLLGLTIIGNNSELLGITFTIASILLLSFSIFFWLKEQSKILTFVLAMMGYLALSTAIIYEFRIPNAFIWLCWQSLIVISTAVWYKSKIIITANFFIYIMILVLYLFLAEGLSYVSLSFGAVALATARILNWKRDRLELKTEQMRNAYLIITLLYIPFVLHNIMPEGFAALSWMGVAVVYYIFSLILKNRKYRWMAVLTLLMSIFYISILGLISGELIYKIMSFLVLGSVLIAVSVLYGRMKNKQSAKNE